MSRKRIGSRRTLFFAGAAAASWPFGTDGDLVINNTVVNITSGSTKDYNSITITNNGQLRIVNNLAASNGGNVPTIIGCKGDCTINTGGTIVANMNALPINTGIVDNYTYSNTAPAGAVISNVSYMTSLGEGGQGGIDGSLTHPGATSDGWGHGGGGGGDEDGFPPTSDSNRWGSSGGGGASSDGSGVGAAGISAYSTGFSQTGNAGEYSAEVNVLNQAIGGGGSGGTRGLNGGCFYLQVAGTLSVSGVVFEAKGAAGGVGGIGGDSETMVAAGEAYGGGGGGGGSGGSGGKIYIRYKLGSASAANCNVTGGAGGVGGAGGTWFTAPEGGADGSSGGTGSAGNNGTTDIASY